VFGTLPDMDAVFTPFFDSVQFIVYHRGISHSLLAVAVLSPLLAWGFQRWYRNAVSFSRWFAFFFLVLLTHILLDCCTTYGTQLFLPFSDYRVAWNTVFIIDPLYTVPFLACLIVCSFLRPESHWRRRINAAGLIVSTSYLVMGFAIHEHVKGVFAGSLARQGISSERFMVCPTPFNTVLWYGVAEGADDYHIGFYSLLDREKEIEFRTLARQDELLEDLKDNYGVNRLIWFANGYYCVREHPNGIMLHILKFGKMNLMEDEELFAFSYLIRREDSSMTITPLENEPDRNYSVLLANLWGRVLGTESSP
ncbi:MAG: metal-dependent hydrolase, partial [Planctomycetaceae bacterium]|nr:metal-dependent hydrolase [Planctomycetaceae bacterium]